MTAAAQVAIVPSGAPFNEKGRAVGAAFCNQLLFGRWRFSGPNLDGSNFASPCLRVSD
jgi:heat shock protein HslJ